MGANFICSRRFLISSIPLLDAPSISNTSNARPSAISRDKFVDGSKSYLGPPSAFNALDKILAVVVFPTPRGPVNIYPWATRSNLKALINVFVT